MPNELVNVKFWFATSTNAVPLSANGDWREIATSNVSGIKFSGSITSVSSPTEIVPETS